MRADGVVRLHLGRFAANWAKDKAKAAVEDFFKEKLIQSLEQADPVDNAAKQQMSAWWLLAGTSS